MIPDDVLIDCSRNRNSATVISRDAIDSAAFLRFEVPNVTNWSVGFLYHNAGTRGSYSITFIGSIGGHEVFAHHWAINNGEIVHNLDGERIPRSVLRSGPNELSFRSTSNGSFLRLNDETVIEVPVSHMIRRFGRSQLCIGILPGEKDRYFDSLFRSTYSLYT